MLKEKYTFKQTRASALVIVAQFRNTMGEHNTTLYFLCCLTLGKFIEKLEAFGNDNLLRYGVSGKKKNFSLTRKEALAFHIMCGQKYLDKTDPLVSEIFTAIDRTL